MNSVRLVVAEDDELQAQGIVSLVSQLRPAWKIQGVVHDREQLARTLDEVVPDVLLLDLHMPEHGAHQQGILDLVRSSAVPPAVILITGDPSKALEAYESAVTDYLLKPPRPARLAQAFERVERALLARHISPVQAYAASARSAPINQWLSGVRGRDIVMVDPAEVLYLQAERKYTIAFLAQAQVMLRSGISDVVSKLDMNVFTRIHRSTIVQLRYIDFIRRDEMGRLRVHIKGRSESLVVSRSFEHAFKGA